MPERNPGFSETSNVSKCKTCVHFCDTGKSVCLLLLSGCHIADVLFPWMWMERKAWEFRIQLRLYAATNTGSTSTLAVRNPIHIWILVQGPDIVTPSFWEHHPWCWSFCSFLEDPTQPLNRQPLCSGIWFNSSAVTRHTEKFPSPGRCCQQKLQEVSKQPQEFNGREGECPEVVLLGALESPVTCFLLSDKTLFLCAFHSTYQAELTAFHPFPIQENAFLCFPNGQEMSVRFFLSCFSASDECRHLLMLDSGLEIWNPWMMDCTSHWDSVAFWHLITTGICAIPPSEKQEGVSEQPDMDSSLSMGIKTSCVSIRPITTFIPNPKEQNQAKNLKQMNLKLRRAK